MSDLQYTRRSEGKKGAINGKEEVRYSNINTQSESHLADRAERSSLNTCIYYVRCPLGWDDPSFGNDINLD